MGGGGERKVKSDVGITLRLAGPIVAGNMGQVLMGMVDTFMIAKIGVAELGASAFVNNIFLVPLVGAIGLLTALPVLVSQAKGAGVFPRVGSHLKHGLYLTLFVSAMLTALLCVNALWLDRYGQETAVLEASGAYYWLIASSLLPSLIYQCLKSFSEGLGWSKPPLVALLMGIGLNIALNWMLIFGHLGFPALGLEGAGWATVVARWSAAAILLCYMLASLRYRRYLPENWLTLPRWEGFSGIFRLGLPVAAHHTFEVGAFAGAGIMIGWLSKEALAAHQVALSFAAFSFMVPLGVSIAASIRVGDAFGSGGVERIAEICKGAIFFTAAQTAVSALGFILFGAWLASIVVSDPVVVSQAAAIFIVVGLFQVFDGIQVIAVGALRGMSDVNVPMLTSLAAYWGVALPLGYLFGFPFGLGSVGVWIGLALGLLFSAVGLLWRLVWRVRYLKTPT